MSLEKDEMQHREMRSHFPVMLLGDASCDRALGRPTIYGNAYVRCIKSCHNSMTSNAAF